MTERARNIVIAAVLAVIAAALTGLYVTNYQRHVQRGEEHVDVWVASRDIPAGTSGADAISKGMLTKRSVIRRAVVPGAISDSTQISTLVAAQTVFAGEQITLRRFADSAVQGIRTDLKGTMRAVQIAGNGQQLLVGTLRAGDHVDLIATFKPNQNSSTGVTRTVLRDIKVLQPPGAAGNGSVTTGFSGTASVILAVTDTQAQKLHFVISTGDTGDPPTWSLDLRPGLKAADSPESVTTLGSVLRDGLRAGQLRRVGGGQ